MKLSTQQKLGFLIGLAASLSVALLTTPYMGVATLAYSLLLIGIASHSNRMHHMSFMTAGVSIDILLVLFLEFSRSAIATAASDTLDFPQKAHVLVSTLAVVLYFPALWLGRKSFSYPNVVKNHRRIGKAAFALRTLGFILMFSLLGYGSRSA